MGNAAVSLKRRGHDLSNTMIQLDVLDRSVTKADIPSFRSRLEEQGLYPLRPTSMDTLQINLGKMCNQVCAHCHVDAGPDRKEIMTRATMEECIAAFETGAFKNVDLTGGAPEMNPEFRWLVEEFSTRGAHIMVRCNLTIILANPKYNDLPEFYKQHNVEVISSLPHHSAIRTDRQRGDGVFDRSIKALKMLNEVGYGKDGTGLLLNLVYNPSGAFLPDSQDSLEMEFKRQLQRKFGIDFNSLYAITNLPISRFLDYLIETGNFEEYMQKLNAAYNPVAAEGVMCRNTLSVGWDGLVYDCDFNQMLDLPSAIPSSHIRDFDPQVLEGRSIVIGQHCYGCTAGAGSSCGGSIA